MYAIFQLSGRQYSAEEGAVLKVPSQHVDSGGRLDIHNVLLVKDNERIVVGTPFVEGATIEAVVLANSLSNKVRTFKYKRRTKYRRTQGHRQPYTEIRINKIVVPSE
ncbi:MAG: 50S ribosomal protein L21 [Candidatus Zixiibacteriota bacterium]